MIYDALFEGIFVEDADAPFRVGGLRCWNCKGLSMLTNSDHRGLAVCLRPFSFAGFQIRLLLIHK